MRKASLLLVLSLSLFGIYFQSCKTSSDLKKVVADPPKLMTKKAIIPIPTPNLQYHFTPTPKVKNNKTTKKVGYTIVINS